MPTVVVPIRSRGVLVKVLVYGSQHQGGEPSAIQVPAGPVMAYLDTGASNTVFDHGFLATLGLRSTRSAALHVLGRDGVSFHDAFAVDIAVVASDQELHWQPLTVLAGPVFQTGAVAALGRDFLRAVTFTYDGPRQRVQLCW